MPEKYPSNSSTLSGWDQSSKPETWHFMSEPLHQWFPTGMPWCHLQYSWVPREKTFFSISLKIHFQNVIKS